MKPTSYWMDTTASTAYPAAPDGLEVDVAVIGGGIAGLCTAWEVGTTGRSVAVLEADRIAAAVTGHTTAKLTALHTLVYAHITKTMGDDAARLYARSQLDAIERVADSGIDCDLERRPAFTYVESQDEVARIEAEAAAAQAAGLPASLVTTTGLPYPVAAAVRVEDQAQFHPRRFLLAMADRMPGVVFERSRVTGLDQGDPCRLTLESGAQVRARHVVVATHYPIFDRAMLFPRLEPHRELVVAAPLPVSADPGGMFVTPEQGTRSVRTAPYDDTHRLLIVTGETFRPGAVKVTDRLAELVGWTRDRFGDVFGDGVADGVAGGVSDGVGDGGGGEPVYRWAAQDTSSVDQVPYVGRLHAGTRTVWVATGFNGWGMTNGVMAGRLLAELIDGRRPEWADLYDPVRLRPRAGAGSFVQANLAVAKHFVGDRLRNTGGDDPARIPPGGGAVLRIGGKRCAVHRDDDGLLHAVSATCTHLGCLVAFNDLERTWDCPCHGSRFAPDGTVVNGPAVKPLPRRELE
jgi:glycine/D-amino acid oxidase-like deaminating enzyme/nitrite reductase/ring-hydroxylating ferredoxin subunit